MPLDDLGQMVTDFNSLRLSDQNNIREPYLAVIKLAEDLDFRREEITQTAEMHAEIERRMRDQYQIKKPYV